MINRVSKILVARRSESLNVEIKRWITTDEANGIARASPVRYTAMSPTPFRSSWDRAELRIA